MTSQEIINELKQLSNAERLAIVEETTRLIRQELSHLSEDSARDRLVAAAKAMLPEYSSNQELTAFTTLDGEEFRSA